MPGNTPTNSPAIVIGAGWAGLAAAVELSRKNITVRVLEAAGTIGGRARSVEFNGRTIDNGQHLLIDAYRTTTGLLKTIGLPEDRLFHRMPLSLHMQSACGDKLRITVPRLPPPFHLLAALLTGRGISLRDKSAALRFMQRLNTHDFIAHEDISVQALLNRERQTPGLVRKLWSPLCLAITNLDISKASARNFINALKEAFIMNRNGSDLLLPKSALGNIFPQPCADFIEQNGGRIETGSRVTRLDINNSRIRGVYVGERHLPASHVVIATQSVAARRLLEGHPAFEDTNNQLDKLGKEPITTVYLQYPSSVGLSKPMTGMIGYTGQWIFDRALSGQPGLLAVVISGDGQHMKWEQEHLIDVISKEVNAVIPDLPDHDSARVIKEKHATFSCSAGIDIHRPGHLTAVSGCWLAGDYTFTGLPATLEGAVRSGSTCARQIHEQVTEHSSKQ